MALDGSRLGADLKTRLIDDPLSLRGATAVDPVDGDELAALTRYIGEAVADEVNTYGGGGGGGSSDHATLTNRSWTVSGHTGTANRVASFNGSGNASLTLLSAIATSGSASDLATGTVPSARLGGAWTDTFFTGSPNTVASFDGSGDVTYTSLATVATSGSAADLTTGTLPAARLPNSGVSPGTFSNATVTVDATGRVTSASSGSAGGLSRAQARAMTLFGS